MILEQIAERTRQRVEELSAEITLHEVRAQAESMSADTDFPFERALRGGDV